MLSIINFRPVILVTVLFAIFYFPLHAQDRKDLPVQEAWIKEYKPFRIAGNLYYVGSYDLASYLITTPQGHILINTGVAESAAMIRKHIEQLGFHFSDIKILLAAHAHYDHVGAIAEIKKMTGARLMINEKDVPAMEDGGNSDYLFGGKGSLFAPVKVDRILHGQRDTIEFAGMKIIALHHPGHTKGATSYLFDVKEEHRSYRVLIANMPTILDGTTVGMSSYPEVANDYAYTLNELKKLQFDLWLCSHASQFDLHTKRKEGDSYSPAMFSDRKGYDALVDDLYATYNKKLGDNQ